MIRFELQGSYPDLPANAAGPMLAALRRDAETTEATGDSAPMRRLLLPLPQACDPVAPLKCRVVDMICLRDPAALSAAAQGGYYLGPPTRHLHDVTRDFGAGPSTETGDALVVVDAGIAFWNSCFRNAGANRFRAIGYLGFEPRPDTQHPRDFAVLQGSDLTALSTLAESGSGQRQLLDLLARSYPDSFWNPAPEPDGFWHGTAMASIVAARSAGPLYGVELPRGALSDSGGDTLEVILGAALRFALRLTEAHRSATTRIVLGFGFPGGPQDGSRPGAAIIAKLIADQAAQGRKVEIYLPSGNHRQDRCHGQMGRAGIDWVLPPEDSSINILEITAAELRELWLRAPCGAQDRIALRPGQLGFLRDGDGAVIGLAHRLMDGRLRLALGPTKQRQGEIRGIAAGHWRVGVAQGDAARDQGAEAWILRDDFDDRLPGGRTRRRSYFDDPAYRLRDSNDAPMLYDMDGAGCWLRRAGTGSVLASASGAQIVTARERIGGRDLPASYSGLPMDGVDYARAVSLGARDQGRGIACKANGTAREFIMRGSSAAVAVAMAEDSPPVGIV